MSKLGVFLKTARKSVGMTQNELSDKLGYSTPQFVSNWERGKSVIPSANIKKFIKITKCDPATLKSLIIARTEAKLAPYFPK